VDSGRIDLCDRLTAARALWLRESDRITDTQSRDIAAYLYSLD